MAKPKPKPEYEEFVHSGIRVVIEQEGRGSFLVELGAAESEPFVPFDDFFTGGLENGRTEAIKRIDNYQRPIKKGTT